jgi:hypothetical protein
MIFFAKLAFGVAVGTLLLLESFQVSGTEKKVISLA